MVKGETTVGQKAGGKTSMTDIIPISIVKSKTKNDRQRIQKREEKTSPGREIVRNTATSL